MGRPLFEVVIPPNPVPPNFRPSLHADSNAGVQINMPRPIPFDSRQQLPPLLPPPPPPPPSPPAALQNLSSRQPIGNDGPPRPVLPQVQRQPETPGFGVLPNGRIRVEGFQPLDRRFATRRKRFLLPGAYGDDVQNLQGDKEEFLPVTSSASKLPDVESFDQTESAVDSEVDNEGSGDSQTDGPYAFSSNTNLRPESGYQENATKIEKTSSKSRFMPKNKPVSRIEQKEESNSISDKIEGFEGSALEEDATVTADTENENSVLGDVSTHVEDYLGKAGDLIVNRTTAPNVDRPATSTTPSVNPNSFPCKYFGN